MGSVVISWATRNSDVEALVRLFVDNTDSVYISHGEIQGGRAVSIGEWATDLERVLANEFSGILDGSPSGSSWRGLLTAADGGKHVGLMVVSATKECKGRPYATLEDIVVAKDARGRRIASLMLAAFEQHLRTEGIFQIFLESSIQNTGAHKVLSHLGFEACSVVMAKTIARH